MHLKTNIQDFVGLLELPRYVSNCIESADTGHFQGESNRIEHRQFWACYWRKGVISHVG